MNDYIVAKKIYDKLNKDNIEKYKPFIPNIINSLLDLVINDNNKKFLSLLVNNNIDISMYKNHIEPLIYLKRTRLSIFKILQNNSYVLNKVMLKNILFSNDKPLINYICNTIDISIESVFYICKHAQYSVWRNHISEIGKIIVNAFNKQNINELNTKGETILHVLLIKYINDSCIMKIMANIIIYIIEVGIDLKIKYNGISLLTTIILLKGDTEHTIYLKQYVLNLNNTNMENSRIYSLIQALYNHIPHSLLA